MVNDPANPARILVVDDDENVRFSIRHVLEAQGHDVVDADSLTSGIDALRAGDFDLILEDINLGEDSGIDVVRTAREEGFAGPIVMITAYASIETAVEAMRAGADDYLQKPLRMDEVEVVVKRLLTDSLERRRLRLYERIESARAHIDGPLGESAVWKKTIQAAERLATIPLPPRNRDSSKGGALPTILITGETGTGKGVIARHIDECARRAAAAHMPPLVHVNCTALPPTLVEAELFGHEKGAFTDARNAREGLFEMADGGTVFLDEIGDMPLDLQAKLLTVIEDGAFRRVGGTRTKTISARIVAASNRDLKALAAEGRFRADLYYRLSTFTIEIPALRDREDDALILATEMLSRYADQYGRKSLNFSDDAEQALLAYEWPGNVRELVNVIQRVAVLCEEDVVTAAELGLVGVEVGALHVGANAAGADTATGVVFDFSSGDVTAERVERDLLIQALERTGGNISKAAALVGMRRTTFRYRLQRQNLEHMAKEIANR